MLPDRLDFALCTIVVILLVIRGVFVAAAEGLPLGSNLNTSKKLDGIETYMPWNAKLLERIFLKVFKSFRC